MRPHLAAMAFLAAGIALVIFAVVNALLLYTAGVPKTTLNVTLPVLGQQVTAKISGVPDPYTLGVNAVRGILLLAIGLIGGKLIDTGLAEYRERRKEEAWRRYYEEYGYQYQQY
ncbi:hypothetical protein [Pyrobaculum aerophilum]|uniref:Uncharacterized protein n=1 Tax=Pyrobaculum aerophilum TaxID=13773 RepID=A0A371QXL0_9CREN|nr:hypothetical protein [Pyrobaculum aerophilum]RFA95263.1 hypothetical protein CGL51_07985 [Pyrobaculum aerophilum]RFA98198.1 hypothetical protein CGL52_08070 [Pyrobaculum aerophilum]